jgi:hypothetical protein
VHCPSAALSTVQAAAAAAAAVTCAKGCCQHSTQPGVHLWQRLHHHCLELRWQPIPQNALYKQADDAQVRVAAERLQYDWQYNEQYNEQYKSAVQ